MSKSKVSFRTLSNRVVVTAEEEKTVGSIVLPANSGEKPCRGVVVAIGPGKITDDGKLIPMTVKVGEIVMFGKYSAAEIKIAEKEYLVLREDDLIAIVEE